MTDKVIINGVGVSGCNYFLPLDNGVKLDEITIKKYNKLVTLYTSKEQECEELKKFRDNNFLDAIEQRKKANRYKQAFDKIKEIMRQGCNDNCPLENSSFCNKELTFCLNYKLAKIQKIIKEVKDE